MQMDTWLPRGTLWSKLKLGGKNSPLGVPLPAAKKASDSCPPTHPPPSLGSKSYTSMVGTKPDLLSCSKLHLSDTELLNRDS